MNRADHIAASKVRALAELDDDPNGHGPVNALSAIMFDLGNLVDTATHAGIRAAEVLAFSPNILTADQVRRFIHNLN